MASKRVSAAQAAKILGITQSYVAELLAKNDVGYVSMTPWARGYRYEWDRVDVEALAAQRAAARAAKFTPAPAPVRDAPAPAAPTLEQIVQRLESIERTQRSTLLTVSIIEHLLRPATAAPNGNGGHDDTHLSPGLTA